MPRKPRTSRDDIIAAALRIVDQEGLDALSMRRLGDALDVEAMSLYRHVPNKAAVLDGIYEAVLGEMRLPSLCGDWVRDARSLAVAFRQVLKNHPRTLQLFATRPAATLGSLAYVERALEVLSELFPEPKMRISAFHTLVAFVVGHSLAQFAVDDGISTPPQYRRLSKENFPNVTAVASALVHHNMDTEFEFGLDALLLGLQMKSDQDAGNGGK